MRHSEYEANVYLQTTKPLWNGPTRVQAPPKVTARPVPMVTPKVLPNRWSPIVSARMLKSIFVSK